MKLKNFTIITIAAAIFALPACKKLTNNSIVVNSDAITAKFTSGTVSQTDINTNVTVAKFADKDLDVFGRLTEGKNIADANGYVTTETQILEGKISKVTITNDDANDARSFKDFYDKIGKSKVINA